MSDSDPRRWWMLAVLGAAELLTMSLWFTASSVAPQLSRLWDLDPAQAGWLTTAVQIGFVLGTALAALLNLADVVPSRAYFVSCAALAAVSNALLVAAPGYSTALGLRCLTGTFLAGVYPPAMKMIATWFRTSRGLAIGTIVGALTVGKAIPYLVRALAWTEPGPVIAMASGAAVLGAVLVAWLYRDGPFPFERRPFSWHLAGIVLLHRPTRLAVAGYLGHMWELYAMWTWVPAFVAASFAAADGRTPGWLADAIAFGAIAAGGLGCLWGGWQADRVGRERLVNQAMIVSAACCLVVGPCFGTWPWLVAAVVWVWGFFVVADSAQFSALVTDVAPAHAVGTALTLQTSLGFLLTVPSIQLIPRLVDRVGWDWAFPALAAGPLLGVLAIRRLQTLRAATTGPR